TPSWVILILTKYYHADMGKVLESSLWRSSDFGTSYTKLTLQPGVTTVIDNFYICPTNKRKIILVSSSLSDRDQSLFLSADEGATFQKQVVPFSVETLIFHPREEDKLLLLAYTKEGKLYVSSDLGRKWTLLQERVTKDHVFWAVSGVDADPDLVHLEAQDLGGGFRYVTCRVHNCSDNTRTTPFAGPIDHGSLTVQDDYVFVKATTTNQTKYYISYRRNDFVLMKLPKYALPKDLQVISTDESQVFVAVQEWYQTDTYNLYQSDTRGVRYSLVLEDVRSSRQAEENVVIDILEVRGVKGVFLANQKVNGKVGRDWDYLRPPSTDMNGKPTNCKPPDCHLHLHLRWADNPYVSGTVHTRDSAPGLVMGAGNLGSQLVEYKEEMYITSDCGHTWRQVFEEEHHILYLDHGGVIVAIKDTSIPLKILKFSVDEGLTWSTHNFTSTSVFVDGLLSEPGDETLVMTVFGHISFRSDWELVKVDFRPWFSRRCGEGDYGSWDLTNLQGDRCVMGQQRSFRRRKPASWCVTGRSFTAALTARVCPCRASDFLCDYGFERAPSSESDANKCFANFWFNPLSPPDDCVLGQTYTSSLGARRSPASALIPALPREGSPAPWRALQGDVLTTKYQVDLGDGFKAMYVNLTLTGEPIRHRYESPGVYRVSVRAENVAGHDEAVLFVQVTGEPIAPACTGSPGRGGRQAGLEATPTVLCATAGLVVAMVVVSDGGDDSGSVSSGTRAGIYPVVSQVPGAAAAHSERSQAVLPTDSPSLGSGGGYWAVAILFVSGLFAVGAFILYKFKRKRPGRTVYAQMHNEKEQEMTSPVSHSQGVRSATQGEEFIEDELHPQTLGNARPQHPLRQSPSATTARPGAGQALPWVLSF
uniref:PKD domain-containing protein n=1 Tax=Capra hircus TaxID=9925 RepID=A0A8C2P175_CAPHI